MRNQITFATAEPAPAPGWLTIALPNGHRENDAIRNAGTTIGMVTISMMENTPAMTYPRAISSPPNINHRMFPMSLTVQGR